MSPASKEKATDNKTGKKRKNAAISPEEDSTPVKRVKTEPGESSTESREATLKKAMPNGVYDDIVFIKIGQEATKFGIHRSLLTKASSFFKEILASGYESCSKSIVLTVEGDTTMIYLPDEDARTFARVNHWFFSRKFKTQDEPWTEITWKHIIDVYLFAVEKGIGALHNTCIDVTILKVKAGGLFPGQDTVNMLWRTVKQTTPLRRLFIKLFAVRCDLKKAILSNMSYHQAFLNWLVIELYEMQKEGTRGEDVNLYSHRKEYYVYGMDNPIPVE